jgi:hypothetical protein
MMRLEAAMKPRVRLSHEGAIWQLEVDGQPILKTLDVHWLKRFAVTVRRRILGPSLHGRSARNGRAHGAAGGRNQGI